VGLPVPTTEIGRFLTSVLFALMSIIAALTSLIMICQLFYWECAV